MSDVRACLRRLAGWAGLLIAACVAFGGAPLAAPARPVLSHAQADAPAGETETRTRLMFDISRRVAFKVFTLANPDRVVIDLDQVTWQAGERTMVVNTGLVRRFRYALNRPGTSRIVVDCSGPASVRQAAFAAAEGNRHRLVVDLVALAVPAARREHATNGAPAAPARTALRWTPPPPQRKPHPPRGPYVVVLDPGHGGADTGAISRSGIHEKDLTLAMARLVRDALRRFGRYEVVFTRSGDAFVKLRERVAIARAADADLLVSLHADAHPEPSVRGASVYTLSEQASDAEAAALAERENKADLIAGVDLSDQEPEVATILIDLAQRETLNQSTRLAMLLVDELARRTRTLRNSHRFAGFAVLKAPDVPSVLVELGYLSNTEDEGLLRRNDHMMRLAAAIALGIDRYFEATAELARR